MATEAEKIAASNQNAANHNSSSTTGVQNNGYTGVSSQHDQAIITNKADLAAIEKHSADAKYAYSQGDKAGVDAAHAAAEAIRAKYDYSGDVNDSQGYEYRSLAKTESGGGSSRRASQPSGYSYTNNLNNLLNQWLAAAQAQQVNKIDYATNTGINELTRAQEDAQKNFQVEQNQISADEAKALDNQALYAEVRGDKGGIGQAQYNTIQNNAAQNRLLVSQSQTKLATDTSRQIADLRAKGEFDKADALLQLSQQYLSQLMNLEKWSAEFGLDVAKFNESVRQWQAGFEMDVGKLMGTYQDAPTLAMRQLQAELDAQGKKDTSTAGWQLLSAGVSQSLTDDQLVAMGITREQANQYAAAVQATLAAKNSKSSGGSGSGTKTGTVANDDYGSGESVEMEMYRAGIRTKNEALRYYNDHGYKNATTLASGFVADLKNIEKQVEDADKRSDSVGKAYSAQAKSDFGNEMQAVSARFYSGKNKEAVQRAEEIAPYLTGSISDPKSELGQLNDLLKRYGYSLSTKK